MISLKMKKKSLRSTFFILPSFLDKKKLRNYYVHTRLQYIFVGYMYIL